MHNSHLLSILKIEHLYLFQLLKKSCHQIRMCQWIRVIMPNKITRKKNCECKYEKKDGGSIDGHGDTFLIPKPPYVNSAPRWVNTIILDLFFIVKNFQVWVA